MVRIVFVIPSFSGGGAERVMLTLIKHIDRKHVEPILIVMNDQGPLRSLIPSDITVYDLKTVRLRNGIYKLINKIRNLEPSVIISTFTHINVTLLALKPLISKPTKLIIREANTPSRSLKSTHSPNFFRFMCRHYYPKADVVLCSSALIENEMKEKFKVPTSKIFRLNNPIDIDNIRSFAPVPVNHKDFAKYFVVAGRLTHQKGFDRLLVDFAKTPRDFCLIILGEGPELKNLTKQIKSLDLQKRVFLEGFKENPWSIISGADAFLLPSRWEGMSNVSLEALACGVSVIATPEAGGIREILKFVPQGSLTIAPSGEHFVKALVKTKTTHIHENRPSLLPNDWDVVNVTKKFENIILNTI